MARLLAAVAAPADDTSAADRFGDQLVAGGLWLLVCLVAAAAAVGRGAHGFCSPRYPSGPGCTCMHGAVCSAVMQVQMGVASAVIVTPCTCGSTIPANGPYDCIGSQAAEQLAHFRCNRDYQDAFPHSWLGGWTPCVTSLLLTGDKTSCMDEHSMLAD